MRDTPGAGPDYDGPTYYDRPSLKPAPFNTTVVGGYIFLAGLAGAAQMLAGLGWPFTIERPAELRAEVRALAARLLTHADSGE